MFAGKDAVRGLCALSLLCLGCTTPSPRPSPLLARGRAPGAAPRTPVDPAPAAPAPRIPDNPQPVPPARPPEVQQTAQAGPPANGPALANDAAAPPADSSADLRRLHRQAAERYAAMDSYIVRL